VRQNRAFLSALGRRGIRVKRALKRLLAMYAEMEEEQARLEVRVLCGDVRC
jgi:hypothetical protein